MTERDEALRLLRAAWDAHESLPAPLAEAVEPFFARLRGGLEGAVPRLVVAHMLPVAAALPDRLGVAPSEPWPVILETLRHGVRTLFEATLPRDAATLAWLGLESPTLTADIASRLERHARSGQPLPELSGPLPDPYDDPLLSLVSYLKDEKREEECGERVGPAEVAMLLGPEPIVGAREALGISLLRWRLDEAGVWMRAQCRLHAVTAEDWVLLVPEPLRGRRPLVRAYLHALRTVIGDGRVLGGLRHVRAPDLDGVLRLLHRLFTPSPLEGIAEGAIVDFESRLLESRFLGGVSAELEAIWPLSPFRKLVREAGSVERALDLLRPITLDVARERYGPSVDVRSDALEETLTVVADTGAALTVLRTEDWEP